MSRLALVLILLAACGHHRPGGGVAGDDTGGDDTQHDAAIDTGGGGGDGNGGGDDAATDGHGGTDAAVDAMADAMVMVDAAAMIDAPVMTGPITGGPCLSGHAGATAYRIRWAGNGAGSTAYPVYEKNGLPDHSRDHTGAYGYQIGFTPTWDDPFLGVGGLVLDGSDFVDIELSTAGLSSISNATLSIFGRSFNTTASGSFNWQSFDGDGYGETPANTVSNSAPYQWYSADMTGEIEAGDNGYLIRIKSGPNSDSLIVNRIEICVTAN